jgi:hypothetical protein
MHIFSPISGFLLGSQHPDLELDPAPRPPPRRTLAAGRVHHRRRRRQALSQEQVDRVLNRLGRHLRLVGGILPTMVGLY